MSVYWYVIGGVLLAGVIALIPVSYVLTRIAPYAYPNARVRAMRGGLVRTQELIDLADRPYNDIIYYLEQNHYPGLSSHTGPDLSYANLDAALRSHLIQTLEKVIRISPQNTKPYLQALTRKYDIQVVEGVVRALAANTNITADILHQTKVFTKEFVAKEKHTLEDLREELRGTQLEAVISEHKKSIEEQEFEAFEEALDLLYFKQLLSKASSQEARGYTKRLIDNHNVALINKGREAIIPGGRVSLEELAGTREEQLVEVLKSKGYAVTSAQPTVMERELQVSLKNYAKALLNKDPLSEASIIGFVALKTINVRNTAILLKMKYHDMTAQEIAEVVAL